jgi:hypothetical protein
MTLTTKVSSNVGYCILGVAVGIFAVIFYIAHIAQVQADYLVDQALGIEASNMHVEHE